MSFSYRKNKLAQRFWFAVQREVTHEITELLKSHPYTDSERIYIKLGAETAMMSLASMVAANNSEPKTGTKWYVHSPRVTKTKQST